MLRKLLHFSWTCRSTGFLFVYCLSSAWEELCITTYAQACQSYQAIRNEHNWSCEMQLEVGTLPNSLSEELQFYSTVHTKSSFPSVRRGGHSIACCHSVVEWDKAQGPRTEQRCGRVWVRRRERQVECDTEQHNAVSWRLLCLQGTELALGVWMELVISKGSPTLCLIPLTECLVFYVSFTCNTFQCSH